LQRLSKAKWREKNSLRGLFFFGVCFEALGADFQIFAAGFFRLQIDGHGSFRGDVGMRAGLSRLGPPSADLAESTHKACNM